MTFTGDVFQVTWENNDFVFKISLPQKEEGKKKKKKKKKMAVVLSQIKVTNPRTS